MYMKLIEITEHGLWDSFVRSQAYAQFTQSWAWGEFRKQQDCQVRRFIVMDAIGDWRAAIQLEKRQRRFGLSYWFAPRGPIFFTKTDRAEQQKILSFILEELQKKSEFKQGIVFWRLEPLMSFSAETKKSLSKKLHWHPSLNPANSAVLDVSPDESALLAAMHSKTRYNIRLAEKHGVTVRESTDPKDLKVFLDLYAETAKRDGFVPQPRAYVQKTFELCSAANMAKLRLAEVNGNILTANIEMAYGDTVMYLYGSSSDASRDVMAPYALHWSAIRDAKSKGFQYYDFGGANPEDPTSPEYKASWQGITRFKTNWGARVWEFVGTWDAPQNAFLYTLLHLKRVFRFK